MTRYPVEKVLAKIAEAKERNPFDDDPAGQMAMIGRVSAFELCEMWIKHYIMTEQFDEDKEAESCDH